MIFGQSRNTLNALAFPPDAELLRLHDGGCRWSLIETSRGTYDWSRLDAHLAASEAKGIPSIYCFSSTPSFAQIPIVNAPASIISGSPGSNLPPDPAMFTEFVQAIVNHVRKPDGTLRIKYWECWNETNFTGFWAGTDAQLLQVAKIVHDVVKGADPTARVTTPTPCYNGPSNTVVTAMDNYLSKGFQQFADIISFHGYLPKGSGALEIGPTIDAMRGVMAVHGVSKPLWDTESGFTLNTSLPDDQKRQWVIDWQNIRAQKKLDCAIWYQADNITHGTLINKDGSLTIAGQAWVDNYTLLHQRLPAVTNIVQVN